MNSLQYKQMYQLQQHLKAVIIARRTSSFMGTKNVGHKSPKPKPQPFGRKIGNFTLSEGKQPDIDFLHDSSHATPYLALNQHGHVDDGSTIFSPSSPSNKKEEEKENEEAKNVRSFQFNPDSGSDDDSGTGGPLLLLTLPSRLQIGTLWKKPIHTRIVQGSTERLYIAFG